MDSGGQRDSGGGGDADAAPPPVLAKIFLAHASSSAPPLRFCFGIGAPDAGNFTIASFPALPDNDTQSAAGGLPFPGLFPGLGGELVIPDGIDPAAATISVYGLNAASVAGDVASSEGERNCGKLIGSNAQGADGGGSLAPGKDFWYLGTVPQGTFAHATTWLAGIIGCAPSATVNAGDPRCPMDYEPATGDLAVKLWELDNTTTEDGGSLGAQFAHASVAWDNIVLNPGTVGGFATAFGMYEPGVAMPGTDSGTDAASDAAIVDAGPPPTAKVVVVPAAHYGDLKPMNAASVSGLTFDGTSGVFAATYTADGGPTVVSPLAMPLPIIQKFAALGDAGNIQNGEGFVFVFVGDPTQPTFLNDAGAGADAGTFNLLFPHFLAFPTRNP